MKLLVKSPGMLTTVQDFGRWGYQAIGMPVAGAMDRPALSRGNCVVGNPPEAAALEITLLGPSLEIQGEGLVALAGADLGMTLNGQKVNPWEARAVQRGDRVAFAGPRGGGCRSYLCISGGVEVPLLMGSRSTYLRGKIGGYQGRALQKGDTLSCGEPYVLWRKCPGFACPPNLRPCYDTGTPLEVILGPQEHLFTPQGVETFLAGEYEISQAADRMGYRMKGPEIEHVEGADIVSDAIPLGAVQVPGQGQPIVMMSDRQVTGGYAKIGVLSGLSVARLAQKLPGEKVRFRAISQKAGVQEARKESQALEELARLRASWVAAPVPLPKIPMNKEGQSELQLRQGAFAMTWAGKTYKVAWKEME